ncbi:Snake venom metalloproteinase atrolysin-B (SVMP) (Hemorrhagic toxin B) (HT-B) (Metalloendopeptidase B), partial [Durusdinium trenchii]
ETTGELDLRRVCVEVVVVSKEGKGRMKRRRGKVGSTAMVVGLVLLGSVLGAAVGGEVPRGKDGEGAAHVPAPRFAVLGDGAEKAGLRLARRDVELGGTEDHSGVVEMRVEIPGLGEMVFDVEVNKHLISPTYAEFELREDGEIVELATNPAMLRRDCHFRGRCARGSGAVAAFSTCHGRMDGVVLAGKDRWAVEHVHGEESARVRHLETDDTDGSRGAVDQIVLPEIKYVASPTKNVTENQEGDVAGDDLIEVEPDTAALRGNPQKLYLEVLVISDPERLAMFSGDAQAMGTSNLRILSQVALFMQNAGFGAIELEVSLSGQMYFRSDPFGVRRDSRGEHDAYELLSSFNEYRRNNMNRFPTHDMVHLFSGRNFQGSTIGLAQVESACDDTTACRSLDPGYCFVDGSGCCLVSSGAISEVRQGELFAAETVTHEIGHQLGLRHDGSGSSSGCSSTGFMMAGSASPQAASASRQFSTCSKNTFMSVFNRAHEASGYHPHECLTNVPGELLPGKALNAASAMTAFPSLVAFAFALAIW